MLTLLNGFRAEEYLVPNGSDGPAGPPDVEARVGTERRPWPFQT